MMRLGRDWRTNLITLYATVSENLFHGFYASGETEAVSVKSGNNRILFNHFHNLPEGDVCLRLGSNNQVIGNRFDGSDGGLTRLRIHGHGQRVIGNLFEYDDEQPLQGAIVIANGTIAEPNGTLQTQGGCEGGDSERVAGNHLTIAFNSVLGAHNALYVGGGSCLIGSDITYAANLCWDGNCNVALVAVETPTNGIWYTETQMKAMFVGNASNFSPPSSAMSSQYVFNGNNTGTILPLGTAGMGFVTNGTTGTNLNMSTFGVFTDVIGQERVAFPDAGADETLEADGTPVVPDPHVPEYLANVCGPTWW